MFRRMADKLSSGRPGPRPQPQQPQQPPAPTTSALPFRPAPAAPEPQKRDAMPPRAVPPPEMSAALRLHYEDLKNEHTKVFMTYIPDPLEVLNAAFRAIVANLYTSPLNNNDIRSRWCFTPTIPGTRKVTVVIDNTKGVAYTIGIGEGGLDKEIHFSLDYLRHCSTLRDSAKEIKGVLTHELVHCYQHTKPPGSDSPGPPGGMIEGIADFVRLKADLSPDHWKRPQKSGDLPDKWDAGYQFTAFFLEWLEDFKLGKGTVGAINDRLYTHGYKGQNGDEFWEGLCGMTVGSLWKEYSMWLDMHDHAS